MLCLENIILPIDDFVIEFEDKLTSEYRRLLIDIVSEIKIHVLSCRANSFDLVQLASAYSPTFNCLDSYRQQSIANVMTAPVFFISGPDD